MAPRLHIVLFQPEIPHNTGAIGRTCLAVGAKLWLVRPLGFRLDDRHLRRAGLDYWERLDWEAVENWAALLVRLPADRLWLFTRAAERLYTGAAFQAGDALVFGGESAGLPRSLLDAEENRTLRIPTTDAVRSLNLSSAVAAAAFEAVRQIGA